MESNVKTKSGEGEPILDKKEFNIIVGMFTRIRDYVDVMEKKTQEAEAAAMAIVLDADGGYYDASGYYHDKDGQSYAPAGVVPEGYFLAYDELGNAYYSLIQDQQNGVADKNELEVSKKKEDFVKPLDICKDNGFTTIFSPKHNGHVYPYLVRHLYPDYVKMIEAEEGSFDPQLKDVNPPIPAFSRNCCPYPKYEKKQAGRRHKF